MSSGTANTDLYDSAKAHEVNLPTQLVENIVRSWTFAAIEQVLRETSTTSLPTTKFSGDLSNGSSSKSLSFSGRSKESKTSVAEQKSMIHPSRSSSLNTGRPTADSPYAQPTTSGQVVFENGQFKDRPPPIQTNTNPLRNGLQELAGTRAQLLAIQRRLLEHTAKALGWSIGWAAILSSENEDEGMDDVDLDKNDEDVGEEQAEGVGEADKLSTPTLGISTDTLVNALASIDQFRHTYEVRR